MSDPLTTTLADESPVGHDVWMTAERLALLVVDVQRDFCPGGALPVHSGDDVVGPLNAVSAAMARRGRPVFASRDWHPHHTTHFKDHGGVWPVHCVAGSDGADFHPQLVLPPGAIIVSKGQTAGDDGYSAFDGHTDSGRSLGDELSTSDVSHLIVGGLATDYCVRASVLDARKAGLQVTLLTDAVRAVDVRTGDGERALDEMRAAGARIATSAEVLSSLA